MEQFPDKKEIMTVRQQLIEKLRDPRGLYDLDTKKSVDVWLESEVLDEGLSNKAEHDFFIETKRAALFFDAGFAGEAIKFLKAAKLQAAKDGVWEFAKKTSENLQEAIDAM